MFNKKHIGILMASIAITVSCASVMTFANSNTEKPINSNTIDFEAFEKMEKQAREEAKKNNKEKKEGESQELSYYDVYLNDGKVDNADKESIKQLKEKSGGFGLYLRELKQIAKELPKDQKRIAKEDLFLKLKDAKEMKLNKVDFLKELDEINGAPDWVGGSGITSIQYYLDDIGTQKLVFLGGETGTVSLNTYASNGDLLSSEFISEAGEAFSDIAPAIPEYQGSPITEDMLEDFDLTD